MTTANESKRQKTRRMTETFDICRQRYLNAGGDPQKSVDCNEWMTQQEQQEFFELGNQVVTDEDVAAYLKKHGSWRDRMTAMKEKMKLGE